MTLNQVVSNLNSIANDHLQINHFFYGSEFNFATSGTVNTTSMIAVLEPHLYSKNSLEYRFKIYIGDIVQKNLSNRADVLSDSLLIALDVIAKLQDNQTYGWMLSNVNNITLNDFEDSFDCELYGYWFTISLKTIAPFDRCAIPEI